MNAYVRKQAVMLRGHGCFSLFQLLSNMHNLIVLQVVLKLVCQDIHDVQQACWRWDHPRSFT